MQKKHWFEKVCSTKQSTQHFISLTPLNTAIWKASWRTLTKCDSRKHFHSYVLFDSPTQERRLHHSSAHQCCSMLSSTKSELLLCAWCARDVLWMALFALSHTRRQLAKLVAKHLVINGITEPAYKSLKRQTFFCIAAGWTQEKVHARLPWSA